MNQLPPGNIAKNNMGQQKLVLIKQREYFIDGNHRIESIYPNENCENDFQSTIDYKSIGFPKYLDLKTTRESVKSSELL